MKNIIGISGKINSGKDTVGTIIQYLSCGETDELSYEEWYSSNAYSRYNQLTGDWEIKKMAGKLKDITCLLIGCTREQLEDREFKETPLGSEWNYELDEASYGDFYVRKGKDIMTPRILLQRLGTEAGRERLHPDIWINSFWTDYKKIHSEYTEIQSLGEGADIYPNWIITDVRFINETQSVKERNGLMIRVNRFQEPEKINVASRGEYYRQEDGSYIRMDGKMIASDLKFNSWKELNERFNPCNNHVTIGEHPSETGLDDYDGFDYVIENDGTIEDLIEKVRVILIKEEIL